MNFPPRFFSSVVGFVFMIIFELTVLSVNCARAQPTSLLDSLQRVVDNVASDTARITALCRLSNAFVIIEYNRDYPS
jgi:hypothetical protein